MVTNPPASTGDAEMWFDLWVGKIPWRRAWQPAPVVLPRVSHGQRSPWGHTELDMAEVTEHARPRRGQSNTHEVVKSVGK